MKKLNCNKNLILGHQYVVP